MIWIGGRAYRLVQEHKDGWKPEAFKERYSEILDRYDYIVGDWGYNQLRLKGFFREGAKGATKDSGIASLQEYLQEYCNFGCAYFVLERVSNKDQHVPGTSPGMPAGTAEGESAAARADQDVFVQRKDYAFSDRKPYSWREDQLPAKFAQRKEERSAEAAKKAAGGIVQDQRTNRQEGGGRSGRKSSKGRHGGKNRGGFRQQPAEGRERAQHRHHHPKLKQREP